MSEGSTVTGPARAGSSSTCQCLSSWELSSLLHYESFYFWQTVKYIFHIYVLQGSKQSVWLKVPKEETKEYFLFVNTFFFANL